MCARALNRSPTMLSTSAKLARDALDAAPDAIIIIDASGFIRFANRQVSALFGYLHDELIGQSIEQLIPERFAALHIGHRKRYVDNPRVRSMGAGLELFGKRRDGAEFPVEISLSPVEEGDRFLVAAAVRDVTDRKHIEAGLSYIAEHRGFEAGHELDDWLVAETQIDAAPGRGLAKRV